MQTLRLGLIGGGSVVREIYQYLYCRSEYTDILSPTPTAVNGYDLVDTEVGFENGAVAHIITGWHLPDSASALTVQTSRMVCTDGWIDIPPEGGGFVEVHPDGIFWTNPLFRTFEKSGLVTGFGMSCPGRIFRAFLDHRNGRLPPEARDALFRPFELGLHTVPVLEGAERGLSSGHDVAPGVTAGPPVDLRKLAANELGAKAVAAYGISSLEPRHS